ncbi:hypothetical protein JOY16_27755, partial [Klebsiella pneumoniae]|uniref:hypothetical protein n=1 Tax=Klebsiella pneumoniae TaxID=573 RepID=UPI00195A9BDF
YSGTVADALVDIYETWVQTNCLEQALFPLNIPGLLLMLWLIFTLMHWVILRTCKMGAPKLS